RSKRDWSSDVCSSDLLGAENFVGTVVWDGSTINSAKLLSVSHDYLVIYAADLAGLQASGTRWRQERPDAEMVLDAAAEAWRKAGGDQAEAQRSFRPGWDRSVPLCPGA